MLEVYKLGHHSQNSCNRCNCLLASPGRLNGERLFRSDTIFLLRWLKILALINYTFFSGNKFDPVNGPLVEYLSVKPKSIFRNSEAQSRTPKAMMCGFIALKG